MFADAILTGLVS